MTTIAVCKTVTTPSWPECPKMGLSFSNNCILQKSSTLQQSVSYIMVLKLSHFQDLDYKTSRMDILYVTL